jgi:hypothetical protein
LGEVLVLDFDKVIFGEVSESIVHVPVRTRYSFSCRYSLLKLAWKCYPVWRVTNIYFFMAASCFQAVIWHFVN